MTNSETIRLLHSERCSVSEIALAVGQDEFFVEAEVHAIPRIQRQWRCGELAYGLTADQVARKVGCTPDAARSAAKRAGIKLALKRRGYPLETRSRAIRMLRLGHSKVAVSEALGVSVSSLRNWEGEK